ncbi:MAG: PAS domain S-box protein [Candidatus Odinarchaeota archaeon]
MKMKTIFEKIFIENLIDASKDTIFVFNPQTGKAVIWNKAFKEVSGYSDNEIKSLKAPDSYYSEEDLKKSELALKEVLESGKTTLEMSLITKDNRKIPYEYTGTILKDLHGNMFILSVGRDFTERKKFEKKLKASEKKYRSLFENMNAGFAFHEVIVDDNNKPIDYKYIEVNPVFEKLTGLKKENLIGKRVTEAIPGTENDPADWIGKFGNVGLTRIPLEVEDYSEAIKKWFKVSGYSPKKGYFAVTVTDITDIKVTEQKLKDSEKRYRLISEASNTVVWTSDMNLNLTYVSSNSPQILGYTAEEAISLPLHSVLTPESLKKTAKIFKEELRLERKKNKDLTRSRTFGINQFHKNGSIIPVEITFTFIRDQDGKINGILGISRDISERKKAEIKLKESEVKFKDLYEEAPNAYFSIGKNKTIIRCNNAAEKLLGYTKAELLKMKVFDLYFENENGIEKGKQVFKRFLNGEFIKDVELQMKNKKGDPIWVSLSVKPILDPEGNVIESRSMILDINEKKSAQLKLEDSFEKLKEMESIINKSPGVVFLWKNLEGWPVEYVSENVKQFGYTPEEFYSGKVIYNDIIHPDDKERVGEEVNRHSTNHLNEFSQEYRIITKSGKLKWLDDRTWIRRDPEGKITHFQGIVLDITDRKKIDEALKLSEKKFKEAYDRANFYKDLFTHDMNNILQIINSSAELISFQLVDSEKSKYIGNMTNMIENQVKRGSKLISNVRTLSDLEEEEVAIKPIEINAFLEKSMNFIKNAFSNRKINISLEFTDGSPLINANELLEDVFENILINAVNYNENSIVEISIIISTEKIDTENYLKIQFIDNGIGVADNRKEVIFKRGYREQKGAKGMGLGLSLVSKILTIFKGKIWVEDRIKGDYANGSNFIILLPLID